MRLPEAGGGLPADDCSRAEVDSRAPDRAWADRARAAAGRHPAPAPAPTPVVNVSIGRIEVRAVPSTSAADRRDRSEEPAVTTLDQYLRRRSGGRT
ncbi:hypothetical protein J5Y04_23835 [Kitasatospora sp. RG8]|uniref:hypothetical protein n=1 Tax=Kitasatospora sp. RG8 TaxID=2820815 RepID=UPI001ADECBAA|nr:hypothetical protein [Kitasatospora sp. RG8]MBP0452552.1 hypothetical protein [Kitasatospora sp. RG8]